jgi:hypothetical protein
MKLRSICTNVENTVLFFPIQERNLKDWEVEVKYDFMEKGEKGGLQKIIEMHIKRLSNWRKMMGVKQAIEVLSMAMKDEDYAWGWQCNIAMSFVDVGGGHLEANKAAANFMKQTFDVDITKFKEYLNIEEKYSDRVCIISLGSFQQMGDALYPSFGKPKEYRVNEGSFPQFSIIFGSFFDPSSKFEDVDKGLLGHLFGVEVHTSQFVAIGKMMFKY